MEKEQYAISDSIILLSLHVQSFNMTIIQVYAPIINEEEAEEFYIKSNLKPTEHASKIIMAGEWNTEIGNFEENVV